MERIQLFIAFLGPVATEIVAPDNSAMVSSFADGYIRVYGVAERTPGTLQPVVIA